MSKLKKAMIKLSPLSILAIPSVAQAAAKWDKLLPKGPFKIQELKPAIRSVLQIMLILAGVVALIYLIIGGYQYITAGGNAETSQAARTTILNAIIGLLVVFASYAVLTWVLGSFLS